MKGFPIIIALYVLIMLCWYYRGTKELFSSCNYDRHQDFGVNPDSDLYSCDYDVDSDEYLKVTYPVDSKSPLNGYEPVYNPDIWNTGDKNQHKNNCYAYAFDNRKNRDRKPSPGDILNKYRPHKTFSCHHVEQRMQEENERNNRNKNDLYKTRFNEKCKDGYSKIFLATAKGDGTDKKSTDYHFYRLDNDGTWSHKAGSTEATKLDASGNEIINPLLANRNYGKYDYKCPCGFWCIKVQDEEFFRTK